MAAVVQKNGMKPLQMVNGNLSHLDVNDGTLNVVKLEDGQCVVKTECVDTDTSTGCYVSNDNINLHDNNYVVKHEYGSNEFLSLNSAVSEANNGDEPEIDIVINNVVCSFSVRCHLNLRQIALKGVNVEYRRENGVSKN